MYNCHWSPWTSRWHAEWVEHIWNIKSIGEVRFQTLHKNSKFLFCWCFNEAICDPGSLVIYYTMLYCMRNECNISEISKQLGEFVTKYSIKTVSFYSFDAFSVGNRMLCVVWTCVPVRWMFRTNMFSLKVRVSVWCFEQTLLHPLKVERPPSIPCCRKKSFPAK